MPWGTRESYIEAESSERIKRTLRHNVWNCNFDVQIGFSFFFQRNSKTWHDPGVVIGLDSPNILINYKANIYRVHQTQLCPVRAPEDEVTSDSGQFSVIELAADQSEQLDTPRLDPDSEDYIGEFASQKSVALDEQVIERPEDGAGVTKTVTRSSNEVQALPKANMRVRLPYDKLGCPVEGTVSSKACKASANTNSG